MYAIAGAPFWSKRVACLKIYSFQRGCRCVYKSIRQLLPPPAEKLGKCAVSGWTKRSQELIKRSLLLAVGGDRRGVSAIVFGISGVMIVMAFGLVIDFATFMYVRTNLNLAADAGVLAAATTAATQLGPNPNNYLTLGKQAGLTRFNAQSAPVSGTTSAPGTVSQPLAVLTVTRSGSVITGAMSWNTSYTTFFGGLFGAASWTMSGVSSADVQVSTPYLNVYLVMDNSPSMEIGATNSDIATLQFLTPCAASAAYYWTGTTLAQANPGSGVNYGNYTCTGTDGTYDGALSCPFPAGSPYTYSTFPTSGNFPSCQGWLPVTNQVYPIAGPPCAFACHFDTTHAAGSGTDFYAVARSTIGKKNQITLRTDVVKAAMVNLINTMSASNTAGNINAAIYTLDTTVTKVYPPSGDAGNAWSTMVANVGGPPTVANGPDTGIQPPTIGDTPDTNFASALTTLASELTAAGGGTLPADPQKVLILITDGVNDVSVNGTQQLAPLDPSYCEPFKSMGYTVFVLYTTYYPLMVQTYLNSMMSWVEGTGPSSLSYNMQQCATSPSDYSAATDLTSVEAALQGFLKIALSTPAHLRQ